ncbi:hypothetical protein B0H17DRAFT_1331723 [Mycena rosella]|uniref:Uncharacterized protein n=1 Tax=Mycena rosella TaxID=1033263 RepID=A0AAD7DHD6_MYCRO|nr:hypothetical protein B0H17DRAFT_1331723 [Mycena rosella]
MYKYQVKQSLYSMRYSRESWIVQLYRDGMLFYAYLLAISIANILVPVLAPSMLSNWLATAVLSPVVPFPSPQRVLHSVLCTRVLLLIRGLSVQSNGLQDSVNLGVHDETGSTFVAATPESNFFLLEDEPPCLA